MPVDIRRTVSNELGKKGSQNIFMSKDHSMGTKLFWDGFEGGFSLNFRLDLEPLGKGLFFFFSLNWYLNKKVHNPDQKVEERLHCRE